MVSVTGLGCFRCEHIGPTPPNSFNMRLLWAWTHNLDRYFVTSSRYANTYHMRFSNLQSLCKVYCVIYFMKVLGCMNQYLTLHEIYQTISHIIAVGKCLGCCGREHIRPTPFNWMFSYGGNFHINNFKVTHEIEVLILWHIYDCQNQQVKTM